MFGSLSISRPSSARFAPSHPRCALMNIVRGCRANRLCCSVMSVSQLGNLSGGLAGVDEHRKFVPGANIENLVEARVVDVDALALAVLQFHAEVLEDFQAL